jgi:hypothetical protein
MGKEGYPQLEAMSERDSVHEQPQRPAGEWFAPTKVSGVAGVGD